MLLEPTSEARDFDVIKEVYISPCCDMHPADNEFSAIKNHSQIIQIELHKNACNQLSSSNYLKLLDKLQNWVNNKKWANRPTYTHHNALDENPEKLIKKIFKNRYHHILNDKKGIFSYKQKELHKLRVNAKELRVIIDELGFIIKNKNIYQNI